MKTLAVISAAFALLASTAMVGSTAFAQTTAKESSKTQKAKAEYVCPMHPEVTSDKPGTCPKCKMDLVKMEKKSVQPSKKAAPARREKGVPSTPAAPGTTGVKAPQPKDSSEQGPAGKSTVTYTCPMHPDVVSDKPGKCPRCKMDLVKNTNDQ